MIIINPMLSHDFCNRILNEPIRQVESVCMSLYRAKRWMQYNMRMLYDLE